MTDFKHELGKEATDIITRVKGIIIARCEHLTACNTYGLAPQALKDGKKLDTEWFDEGRLRITGDGITKEDVKSNSGDGCDQRDHP